ncbi:putative quinol monooxygenase [Motilimonas pumila]|uniref:Antibiotic biosynthesis monooxygenase n=1 Tax=Motilimonas pumila TaxID=2303987 RepID=A0A418YG89_9GAMM|nr:putative quinol monooxygenase [Motilimonas pumila]RJG48682.1 antibiotic biosynthesis monooxygenase [Motilimonas pumila]
MPTLTIIAHIHAHQDHIDTVKAALIKLIDITRSEVGCVNYDLHQDNENPAHFVFYENWQSRELWRDHMENQHLKDYMSETEGKVAAFTVHEMSNIA